MSLLGKILTVLNLMAACAFFYFAGTDYASRQQWAFLAYRYDLAIDGFPLDNQEKDPLDNLPLVELMPEDLPQKLGVSGIRTQEQAVEQARRSVLAEIDGKDGDDAKRLLIGQYLAALAVNFEVRRNALERAKNPDTNVEEFKKELVSKFDDCSKTPGEKKEKLSAPNRKHAIAHLLFNLVPDQATEEEVWRERSKALTIVGAKEFRAAADMKTAVLNEMIVRQQQLMERDMTSFSVEHGLLVKRIYEDSIHLKARERDLLKLQELERRHQKIVTDREDEVQALLKSIAEARIAANKALAIQEQEEKKLFELQKKIDQASNENKDMESKIRQLETSGR